MVTKAGLTVCCWNKSYGFKISYFRKYLVFNI